MDSPLFRPESIEHQRERLFGEALVVWPVTFKIVLLCAVLTAVTFASFVTWGEYTRKARVSGYVVPSSGFVKVYAREVATITARRVSEGDKVKKGDVLFLLAMDR
ncbi:MAG: hemolysin D, partial [Rhodocyclaceae bacterium]|nr:hemolysin D [Rhodocyclaceae bacterium]